MKKWIVFLSVMVVAGCNAEGRSFRCGCGAHHYVGPQEGSTAFDNPPPKEEQDTTHTWCVDESSIGMMASRQNEYIQDLTHQKWMLENTLEEEIKALHHLQKMIVEHSSYDGKPVVKEEKRAIIPEEKPTCASYERFESIFGKVSFFLLYDEPIVMCGEQCSSRAYFLIYKKIIRETAEEIAALCKDDESDIDINRIWMLSNWLDNKIRDAHIKQELSNREFAERGSY